ncbi:MAG: ABC transporter ATP-binding protein [Chloroflexota bacterium]|nr:ABC transporter ATP-binding protein [Chloroflexota bacterium]
MSVIEVQGLTKDFNGLRAVDGIGFSVEEGEVFGFLGPNGAGKTTTIKILTGQLTPTAGWARVAGYDIVTERYKIKPLIGVVFEEHNIYERLSGRENLAFYARLYGVEAGRVDELLEMVGLAGRARDAIRTYSNGMKQRLMVARALLSRPRILFLDEPTRGLDPVSARAVRGMIAGLSRGGITIFLTTHYLEEADQLCRRVAFLDEGKVVALGAPQNLKVKHGERFLRAVLKDSGELRLSLDDPADGQRLGKCVARGEVLTLHSQEATLEEVFIHLTGRRLE